MFQSFSLIRDQLGKAIANKSQQGHQTDGLSERLAALPDSYDALYDFARHLEALPLREDWPYVEPNDLDAIWAECDPARPTGRIGAITEAEAAQRAETAFLASVCGCVLGKPLEFNPTLDQIRGALESIGEWPLNDYVSEQALQALGRKHESPPDTTRGNIRYVANDDDINYTILGMLVLENYGLNFTTADVALWWLLNLPPFATWGPERLILLTAGLNTISDGMFAADVRTVQSWASFLNPMDELCGALIRADAYGYACPGRPALAAELAWRDAILTHRRTGLYGPMFVAAAIAAAPVTPDPLQVFEIALGFVPRRSRFYRIVADCLNEVRQASDWLDGYARIHGKYGEYSHCQNYQEVGTLINTLRFAENIGDGICKQVSQGNDTDSFGATAGSLLGMYFGPSGLDARWLAPFRDDLHTTLAMFYERSLMAVARRMGQLPIRFMAQG